MKNLIAALFLTIAATACATESASPTITCGGAASCADDPRLPAARAAVSELGYDLEADVHDLALTSATNEREALASVDGSPGTIELSACHASGLHGACCWIEDGGWIKCVGW